MNKVAILGVGMIRFGMYPEPQRRTSWRARPATRRSTTRG